MSRVVSVTFWGGPLDGEVRTIREPPYYYELAALDQVARVAAPTATLLIKMIRYRLEPTAAGGWRYVVMAEGDAG